MPGISTRTTSGRFIEVTGATEVILALRAFEPEVHKRIMAEIRTALRGVAGMAKQLYPGGAWTTRLRASESRGARGSVMTAPGSSFGVPRWADAPPGAKAAIFEFAGKNQPGKTPQARATIESLNRRYGKPGRFLWESWDMQADGVLARVEATIREGERELQKAIDSADSGSQSIAISRGGRTEIWQ